MEPLTVIRLISIPLLSALTGYVTNHIAVRMLFRPREPWRLPGFRLQGLIPRRRGQIAHSIGETVERHLISHDDIRSALMNPAVSRRIHGLIEDRVNRLLAEKINGIHPMMGMFMNDKTRAAIKTLIMDEVMQGIGPMTGEVMDMIEDQIDFRDIVIRKIENFDLNTFESIVLRIASRELRAIEILGGVLGFVIGLMTDLLLLL